MSGSGPSLFALFPDLEGALAAQERLALQLDTAGFESWCCLLRPQGVSLDW
jgi:4-diphosphocytidyl-2-C-methyl-D-erythritol kinase